MEFGKSDGSINLMNLRNDGVICFTAPTAIIVNIIGDINITDIGIKIKR